MQALKTHFAPHLEVSLPRAFECAVYGQPRNNRETMQEYIIRQERNFHLLEKEGCKMDETAVGYIVYRQAASSPDRESGIEVLGVVRGQVRLEDGSEESQEAGGSCAWTRGEGHGDCRNWFGAAMFAFHWHEQDSAVVSSAKWSHCYRCLPFWGIRIFMSTAGRACWLRWARIPFNLWPEECQHLCYAGPVEHCKLCSIWAWTVWHPFIEAFQKGPPDASMGIQPNTKAAWNSKVAVKRWRVLSVQHYHSLEGCPTLGCRIRWRVLLWTILGPLAISSPKSSKSLSLCLPWKERPSPASKWSGACTRRKSWPLWWINMRRGWHAETVIHGGEHLKRWRMLTRPKRWRPARKRQQPAKLWRPHQQVLRLRRWHVRKLRSCARSCSNEIRSFRHVRPMDRQRWINYARNSRSSRGWWRSWRWWSPSMPAWQWVKPIRSIRSSTTRRCTSTRRIDCRRWRRCVNWRSFIL